VIAHTTLAFVFATSMEANPFIAKVNAQQILTEPWPTYRVKIAGQLAIIIITGMGMQPARMAVEFIIENHAANAIFNCGVAGSLTDYFIVGDIINISSSWIFHDGELDDDVCHLSKHSQGLSGYTNGSLLTVDRPVFDPHQKKTLSNVAQLVDMEGGMIARLCAQHNIPCQLIKIISDTALERNQLKHNLCNVSEKLADRVTTDITGLFSQEMTA